MNDYRYSGDIKNVLKREVESLKEELIFFIQRNICSYFAQTSKQKHVGDSLQGSSVPK